MASYSHAAFASTDATVSDPPSAPQSKTRSDHTDRAPASQRHPGVFRHTRDAFTRLPQLIRRHLALTIVLALGAIVRAAIYYGYGPAYYFSDTRGYFEYANLGIPQAIRGYGYSEFLNLFRWTDSVWPITITQHLIGLIGASAVYALVLRRGGPRWLAIVAAIPIAFDGYELVVEHYLLGDSLTSVLVLLGFVCLMWQDRLTVKAAAFGGLFFALALLTRSAALPVIPLAGLYVLVRRVGWRQVTALVLAVAIPTLGYTTWFHHYYGKFSLSTWQNRWMYGRVMSIADCKHLKLNPPEKLLCNRPENDNAYKVDWYVWSADSPVGKVPGRYAYTLSAKVMLQQPLDFSRLVARETWAFFSLDFYLHRKEPRGTTCPQIWEFPYQVKNYNCSPNPVASTQFGNHRGAAPATWSGTVPRLLYHYQRYGGVTPGPLLALCLLLVIAALLAPILARRRGIAPRPDAWRLRWDALLLGASALGLLIMAAATSQFDIRYGVSILALLPPAGALAWVSLRRTLRPRPSDTSHTPSRSPRTESEVQGA